MNTESHQENQDLDSQQQAAQQAARRAASRSASQTTTSFREPTVRNLELDLEGLIEDEDHSNGHERDSDASTASDDGSEKNGSQAQVHQGDVVDDSEYDFYASTKHIAHIYRALKAIQPAAKVYEGGQGVGASSYARSMGTGRGNPFTTQSTQRHRKGDSLAAMQIPGFDDHDSDGDLGPGAHLGTEEDEALARMVSKDVPVTVMIDENGLAFNMGRVHMGIARVYLERSLFATYRKSDPDALYTFALPMHRLLQCLKILAASESAASRSGAAGLGMGGAAGGGVNRGYNEEDEFSRMGEDGARRRNLHQRANRAEGEDDDVRSNMICRIKYKATGDETFVLVFEDGQNMAIKCEFPVLTVDPYSETLPLGSDEEDDLSEEDDDEDEEDEEEDEEEPPESQISDSEEEDNELFFGRKKDDEKKSRQQEREQAREERRKIQRELRREQRREQRRLEHQTGRVMGLDISNLRFKVLFRGKILAQKLHEMIVLQTSRLQIRASNEAPRLSFVSKAEMSDSAQYFPEMDAFPSIERFFLWTQPKPMRTSPRKEGDDQDEESSDGDQAMDEDVATFWYDFRQITMAIEGISIGETQNIRCDWNGFMGIQSKYVVDREQRIYIFFDFRFSALHE